jgi:hypothetical protein
LAFDRRDFLIGGTGAGAGKSLLPVAVADQTVVPDFNEAFGQEVQAETPDKFRQRQGHGFELGLVGVILVTERHRLRVHLESRRRLPMATPMGVAAQAGQHLLRTDKRALGIDDPRVLTPPAPSGQRPQVDSSLLKL